MAGEAETRTFRLEPSEDGVELQLTIEPGADTDGLAGEVLREAASMELAVPVDRAAVEKACRAAGAESRVRAVIARGTAVRHARDAHLVWSRNITERNRDSGRFSHYLGRINNWIVRKGTPIARLAPPERGRKGRDIFGNTLEPEEGKPLAVRTGRNVVLIEDVFFARQDGLVRFDGSELRLDRIFPVQGDLGFDTGNIDFPGTVTI